MNGSSQHSRKIHGAGFTLVEILVICTVLIVLTLIGVIAFEAYQRQSRDGHRAADISYFQAALEAYYDKNGIYPAGCFTTSKSSMSMGSCTSVSDVDPGDLAPDWIGYDSAPDDLQAFLPRIPDTFGDPLMPAEGYPFGNTATPSSENEKRYRYYYAGSHPSDGTVGTLGGVFGCPNLWDGQLNGTNPSNYFLAYWSESENSFIFKHGNHGSLYEFREDAGAPEYCRYT